MPKMIHDHTQIGTADVQLMAQFGVPAAFVRILLRDAGLPIPNHLASSDADTSPGLLPDEEAILREGGASGLGAGVTDTSAKQRMMALDLMNECKALVDQSYGLYEVAKRLQLSSEAVRACVSGEAPDLYAFQLDSDGPWLFPRWQFYELGRIPGLGHLLSAAGESVNPLVVSRFMWMQSIDLENDNEIFSPREWLIKGFELESVLMLVRDF
ncbi:hypothetical protein [Marinobacter xestospongiae]|uniref:Uncharacterized protein n=1 Tax=Marinobacter xestospongiae TaxID=994319 RepID=A0ABU3W213_9GAMM|nr:hypothetical protein [Marinobacter xestospongiae]MDV2080375.1 hypothetical protein [Marinobacter xestospongiae]